MTNEQFTQLSPEEKARIESSMKTLQERLQKVIRQVQQLQKLMGFKFTRHPSINWPEERLEAIEKHIQDRVLQLLQLPRNKNIGSQER